MAERTELELPPECECAFFDLLSEEQQKIDKGFRLAALNGHEPIDARNSMCFSCIKLWQTEEYLRSQQSTH